MEPLEPQPAEETTLDTVVELADVLGAGLDRDALAVLARLSGQGVSPAALAAVVSELRREKAALDAAAR